METRSKQGSSSSEKGAGGNSRKINRNEKENCPPSKQIKTRKNYEPEVTNTLLNWLYQHLQDPYPSDEEKQKLVETTGLDMEKIDQWFINARRRKIMKTTVNGCKKWKICTTEIGESNGTNSQSSSRPRENEEPIRINSESSTIRLDNEGPSGINSQCPTDKAEIGEANRTNSESSTRQSIPIIPYPDFEVDENEFNLYLLAEVASRQLPLPV